MRISKLLASSSFLTINKYIVELFGLESAIVLADLISKEEYFKNRNDLQDGYFFNTNEDINSSTSLSYYQIKKGVKVLEDNQLLKSKLKGIPARTYYKINYEVILELFKIKFSKIQKLDTKKLKTINNNKNNNNKFFINKELNRKYLQFLNYRKELKKKCTKTTIDLQVKKLSIYDPSLAIQMIDKSMENGWAGLFEIKEEQKKGNTYPDYYDRKFAYHLKPNEHNDYLKHLRSLGFSITHSSTAGVVVNDPKK